MQLQTAESQLEGAAKAMWSTPFESRSHVESQLAVGS
jgi:hypothetical protein